MIGQSMENAMGDSYQAIYDAVRSRISNGDVGRAIADIAHRSFDISHTVVMLQQEFSIVAFEMQRPSVLFHVSVRRDDTKWTATYWEVIGIGESPDAATRDFDKKWTEKIDVYRGS
jgi:hypothetical protein